jgi:uncharacterized membrane protein YwzB
MNLVSLLITVLILGLIFGIVWWGIQQISMPPPFKNVAIGIFVLIVVLVLVGLLMGDGNVPMIRLR